MAWKDLAEELQHDLQERNNEIARLQRQLAEREEEGGGVHQLTKLQNDLQALRAENQQLIGENASLDETLQNTLKKLDEAESQSAKKIEKLLEENRALKDAIAEKENALRMAQAQLSSDQALSVREKKLQDQIVQLESELATARTENATLTSRNGNLNRYDQDDEEPLAVEDAMLKAQSQKNLAAAAVEANFKTLSIPDDLKPTSAKAKKAGTAAQPKKRKRSDQEKIDDDEVADLDASWKEDVSPKRRERKKVAYDNGFFAGPDDDSDDAFEPMAPKAKKTKGSTFQAPSKMSSKVHLAPYTKPTPRAKISLQKPPVKRTPVEPLTPVSPVSSSTAPEEISSFTFRAVCNYKESGSPDHFYKSSDLKHMTALWDRIRITTAIWEARKGDGWSWEFERSGYNLKMPDCITKKLQGQRTKWHKGCEGVYVCKECVQVGRPCFTFVELEKGKTYDYAEFRLLPLRECDRKQELSKKYEIRRWLNDDVDLVDEGDMYDQMDWD